MAGTAEAAKERATARNRATPSPIRNRAGKAANTPIVATISVGQTTAPNHWRMGLFRIWPEK